MEKLYDISLLGFCTILLSTLGIYLSVIILTRICGKRSFSKMSSFDFAMTVAVGSIIATTALSSSVSLVEGAVGLTSVYVLQIAAAFIRRNDKIQSLMDNTPLLLMDGQVILTENLRKARVTERDLRSCLRAANVKQLSEVKAVVFETTGDISVLHAEKDMDLDLWLMQGVDRS